MKAQIRVEVSPSTTIRVREDSAWAQVFIDDLTLDFHGLSWPSDAELTERIGVIDRMIAALQTIRSGQLKQAVATTLTGPEWSEAEKRYAAGDR